MCEQVKKQTKYMSNTNPIKTGEGWLAVPPSYKTPTVLPIVRSNTNCVGDRGEQV